MMTEPIVRIVSANTDFVRGHDATYVRQLCEWGDVLLLQEHKYANLADNLPDGWASLQDTTSEATKGSCIAYDTRVLDHGWDRLILGAEPFIGGRRVGLLPRYFQVARLVHKGSQRGVVVVSAHEPPFRFRVLQPGYSRRLHATVARYTPDVVVGADANMPLGRFANTLGLEGYGKGIVGIATRLPVVHTDIKPWGIAHGLTDHPAVVAHVALVMLDLTNPKGWVDNETWPSKSSQSPR